MKHIFRKRFTWIFALALAALMLIPIAAFAHVATDQADYSPGSVVTISGDNSDNAGYQAGETVHVQVSGPNGYTASCDGTADDSGAWSCQVTGVTQWMVTTGDQPADSERMSGYAGCIAGQRAIRSSATVSAGRSASTHRVTPVK